MHLDNLQEKHTYLVKKNFGTDLYSITILCKTKEAYQIRRNNDSNIYVNWNSIKDFDDDYRFVEDITTLIENSHNVDAEAVTTDFLLKQIIAWIKKHENHHPFFLIKETCPICNGAGTLQNGITTSLFETCSNCRGAGTISKRIDILFE